MTFGKNKTVSKHMKNFMISLGTAAMVFAGCAQNNNESKPAIDLANFDNPTTPAEDFYQYACGGWMEANPLTPEYARYGIFDQLDKENQDKLKVLIDELNSKPQEEGSVGDKISTLYAQGLDMDKRNADGAAPVKEQLAAINAVTNLDELSAVTARTHMETSSPFFSIYIGADEKNSTMNLLQFYQGGISMGDRDYYLLDDEASVKMRNAYKNYINTLFTLAGYSADEAAKAADAVMKFEELQAIFNGKEIDLTTLEETSLDNASYYGRIFARLGGLSEAVVQVLKEKESDFEVKGVLCDGIDNIKMALNKMPKKVLTLYQLRRIFSSLPPAVFSRPPDMVLIPKRKRARPPRREIKLNTVIIYLQKIPSLPNIMQNNTKFNIKRKF